MIHTEYSQMYFTRQLHQSKLHLIHAGKEDIIKDMCSAWLMNLIQIPHHGIWIRMVWMLAQCPSYCKFILAVSHWQHDVAGAIRTKFQTYPGKATLVQSIPYSFSVHGNTTIVCYPQNAILMSVCHHHDMGTLLVGLLCVLIMMLAYHPCDICVSWQPCINLIGSES